MLLLLQAACATARALAAVAAAEAALAAAAAAGLWAVADEEDERGPLWFETWPLRPWPKPCTKKMQTIQGQFLVKSITLRLNK